MVDGGAEFKIKYSAIVYRPFRGEVVDGVVTSVNKVGSNPSQLALGRAEAMLGLAGMVAKEAWLTATALSTSRRWASSPMWDRCSASFRRI